MDEFDALDPDCVYRMIALACASMVVGVNKEHTHVMAVADSFLEYIDPISDSGVTFTLEKDPKGGK